MAVLGICLLYLHSQPRSGWDHQVSVLEVLCNCVFCRGSFRSSFCHTTKQEVTKAFTKTKAKNISRLYCHCNPHSSSYTVELWTHVSFSKYFKIFYKDEWVNLLILLFNLSQKSSFYVEVRWGNERWNSESCYQLFCKPDTHKLFLMFFYLL